MNTEEALQAEIDKLQAELTRWRESFSGHVYVPNEEYGALCTAVKDPSYITSLKAQQMFLVRENTMLREKLAGMQAAAEIDEDETRV